MANKVTIKHRFTDTVLFEHTPTDEQQASGLAARAALEAAVKGGANLRGANLDGAYLGGANLDGAYLDDKKLVGQRPIFMIGPIGSRSDYFVAYITDTGLYLRAGCFFGTRDEFIAKLEAEHGDNLHGREYRAALALIDVHAEIWKTAEEPVEAAS